MGGLAVNASPCIDILWRYVMKRVVCLLLSIVMISIVSFSIAQNNHVPFIQNISAEEILDDWADILELDKRIDFEPQDKKLVDNLHSDNPPDFFSISGDELPDLLTESFCAPFTPSEKMLEEINAMPPIIQQALKENIYTQDGRLYAYPKGTELLPMLFWVPEAWKDSPFNDMTPPASYVDLLDFMEKYLDTPHEGFCFYYDLQEKKTPQVDWVSLLLKCWVMQCRYQHQEANLNNPEFVSLLKRTVELANRLHKAEPNIKKQKGRQLITKNYFGYTTNGQDQYTWKNMIPWRITADQLPLVDVNVYLYCARNGGIYSDRITELFDCIVDHRQDLVDGAVDYLSYLELNKNWIDVDNWNNRVIKKYGAGWKCFCMTQEYVDSIWEIEQYGIPCMVDDDYLSDVPWQILEEKCPVLIRQCAKGEISAEDFVTEMDRLVLKSD